MSHLDLPDRTVATLRRLVTLAARESPLRHRALVAGVAREMPIFAEDDPTVALSVAPNGTLQLVSVDAWEAVRSLVEQRDVGWAVEPTVEVDSEEVRDEVLACVGPGRSGGVPGAVVNVAAPPAEE